MAPLKDDLIRDAFLEALSNWNRSGYVDWRRVPSEWMRKNIDGHTLQSVAGLMFLHVLAGGEIDQVRETREPWRNVHDLQYDFRFRIGGRKIYIETVIDISKMGPTVTIVSMHDE